jgi:hypothetical protein
MTLIRINKDGSNGWYNAKISFFQRYRKLWIFLLIGLLDTLGINCINFILSQTQHVIE